MVRCEVCGKEVLSGWVCGVPPAPDSQKLGLCEKHDTAPNRAMVLNRWEELIRRQAASMAASPEAAEPTLFEVRISFMDRGTKTIVCKTYNISQDRELLVLGDNDVFDFYPLEHVRSFTVSPLATGAARDASDTEPE